MGRASQASIKKRDVVFRLKSIPRRTSNQTTLYCYEKCISVSLAVSIQFNEARKYVICIAFKRFLKCERERVRHLNAYNRFNFKVQTVTWLTFLIH